jgi:hypothetical protein
VSGPESRDIFDFIKLYIVNIALCVLLLLGIFRLILEEFKAIIPIVKQIKSLLKR